VLAVGVLGGAAKSDRVLTQLQTGQRYYANAPSNLPLEPVDFSTPGGVARGLPLRLKDFLARPYPWQVANTSQRLGVLGSLIFWTLLAAAIVMLVRDGRTALARAGPFIYLAAAVTVGYALSTANAGTGFRYRMHLTILLVALVSGLVGASERGQRLGHALGRVTKRLQEEPRSFARRSLWGATSPPNSR
jgi:hypothetical protein